MDQPAGAGWAGVDGVATAPRRSPVVNVLLLAATAFTMTVAGALLGGVDPTRGIAELARGIPFAATLLAILIAHEAGHYLMCRRYGMDASLPYFLPAPFLFGTLGAFIRIRSRFPNRRALFDVGVAGPWAGFVVALVVYVEGLRLSVVSPVLPPSPGFEIGDSLLTALLARLVLGVDPSVVTIRSDPVAAAGWFGLFVTSLNLLPIGQLDGGHALYATAGRRLRFLPPVVIATLLWLGLRGWFGWVVWAVLLSILLGLGHPPTRDDALPLGRPRTLAAVATLVLFVLTFVPEPLRVF